MPTTVVNIKTTPDFDIGNPNDVYIGRFHQSARYGTLPESKWHNPFWIIPGEVPRIQVIELYRDHIVGLIKGHPDIYNLDELEGKRLGCWCKPLACHGDILVELVEHNKAGGSPK